MFHGLFLRPLEDPPDMSCPAGPNRRELHRSSAAANPMWK